MKKFTLASIILLVLLSGCSQKELDTLNEQITTLNQEKETLIRENKEAVEDLENQVVALTQKLEEMEMLKKRAEMYGKRVDPVKLEGNVKRVELDGLPFVLEYTDFTNDKLFFYASPKGLNVAYYNDRPNEALYIEVFAEVYVLTTAELNQIGSEESSNYVKVLKNLNNGMVVGLILPVGGIFVMVPSNVESFINDTIDSFIAK
jgi:outer membrane murein-binding lipoprotein Lpp